jgi:hypothetical protein
MAEEDPSEDVHGTASVPILVEGALGHALVGRATQVELGAKL